MVLYKLAVHSLHGFFMWRASSEALFSLLYQERKSIKRDHTDSHASDCPRRVQGTRSRHTLMNAKWLNGEDASSRSFHHFGSAAGGGFRIFSFDHQGHANRRGPSVSRRSLAFSQPSHSCPSRSVKPACCYQEMLASRRFRVALGCCVASALALVLADKEAAFDPQHIVLGKNGQVQDVDPSLYFHERAAKKKTSAARASVVRTELQHTQQYQLKTNGHAEKAGAGARSPKLSISRVSDVEAQPTKTVEAQLHTAAAHGPTNPSDAKAAPQPHKKSKATKKKVEAAMRKAPGSTEKREPQQRRRTLMERRSLQAQVSLALLIGKKASQRISYTLTWLCASPGKR